MDQRRTGTPPRRRSAVEVASGLRDRYRAAQQQQQSPQQNRESAADGDAANKARSGKETLEAENDLIDFLKVSRPSPISSKYAYWPGCRVRRARGHMPRPHAQPQELMRRVVTNTINMDLSEAGHSRFCDETIQALRSERSFLRALEYCREPYYRRAGIFAPVPLLLARSYAQTWGEEAARAASAAPPTAGRKSPRRPASAPMKPPREPQGIDNGTNDTGSMVKLDAARPSTALNRRSVVNRQPGGPADSQLQRMGPCSSAPALVGHIASAPSLKFCRGDSALCTEKNEEAGLAASERPRLRFAEGRGRRRDPSRSREAPRRPAARGFAGPRPPAATMLAMVGRASTFSRSASASADGGDDEEVDPATALFEAQVERLQQATAGLRSQPRIAAWRQPGGSLGSEEPGCVHPGVARAARKVLAEGQAMEQKDNLLKQMRREGHCRKYPEPAGLRRRPRKCEGRGGSPAMHENTEKSGGDEVCPERSPFA